MKLLLDENFSPKLAALQGTLLFAEDHQKLAIIERKKQELEQAWQKLLIQEKLTALGSFVAGVAHEINTPLGIAITSVSMIVDSLAEYTRPPSSGSVEPNKMDSDLDSLGEAGAMAMRALERAAELVQSFKQVAVDQWQEFRREFDLKNYLSEVLRTPQYRWERTEVVVELEGEDSLILVSYPGHVGRVVSLLVSNALDHGFDETSKGRIVIEVGRAGRRLSALLGE